MADSMVPMIDMRGVSKRFGDKVVLNGVDLSVDRGESLVIIGGSGSGKSVTLKCVLGLLIPEEGEIYVDGDRLNRAKRSDQFLSRFGMLFQGGALFDSLSVWENVSFRLLQQKNISRDTARAIAIEKLRRVGLNTATADLAPAELSGGMQKRVSLARAIAADPEIIFFDEPTTGLDPIMSFVINTLIRELVTDLGATAITITHDMASARAIADDVMMLHRGKFRWRGHVSELDTTQNEYVRQFVSGAAEGPIETLR
jgi:phospholipid/cholesterol/gamma-HCH transport system ATP-binding protein